MTTALQAWAAVLDGWIDEIASSDARTFDRLGLNSVANLWVDGGISSFVAAAVTRSPPRRRRYAEDGLRWLAESNSGRHRGGSHLSAEELRAGYDLAEAEVHTLLVERSNGVMRASVELTGLRRRYSEPAGTGPVKLALELEELRELVFDADDLPGWVLSVDDSGISITGESSRLRASRGKMRIEDSGWRLAAAGRTADATTLDRPLELEARGLTGEAQVVAHLLTYAMLELRGVYATSHLDPPHTELCKAFIGAGNDILAAGSGFRRDAAFRRLIGKWVDAGGEDLAWWFRSVLDAPDSKPDVEKPQPAPGAESELLLIHYLADFPPGHTSTTIQVASPPVTGNGPWVRRGLEITDPAGCSFALDAFDGSNWRRQLAGTRHWMDDKGGCHRFDDAL